MGKMTILDLQRMKYERKKITMLTAYDYPTARILDSCGVDIILVGDSVGNVILGEENTLPVSVEDMIHHTKAVTRGAKDSLVVIDMPFMSYQISTRDAKRNAGRMIKESGAEAVKLEGGTNMEDTIKAITDIDIPVMAHIGLTPQSVHRMGGYRVQGKEDKQREKLTEDALAVERAGAFSVVLEVIPSKLAHEITEKLKIPTIGIGAGVDCDGQVLVINDLLGLSGEFRPKFVKRYVQMEELISKAVKEYISEVRAEAFPGEEHSFQ
ncbi:MAG: 3-methyl-2-oxobutanoate hydroxymethyltransferase [Thermodesulfobacteriota bacterium]|nr:3-methyl-2-oxobutanoate hydroxymethyltransferase [Thermodesulfobacteriota bacterium]